MCYINRQTQPDSSSVLAPYSVLLHVSAVYISHHHVGIGSQKRIKRTAASPNIQWCKVVKNSDKYYSEKEKQVVLETLFL